MTCRRIPPKDEGGRQKYGLVLTPAPRGSSFILYPSSFILAAAALLFAVALSGCGTVAKREPAVKAPGAPAPRAGGYYLDDGPGENPPADLDSIPEPTPRLEPLQRGTGRPYVVMGRSYTPMTSLQPYKARGIATWYGRRYHGRQTSSGEIYDMYGMTAAHPILPIPSYARVTNLVNGKSVIVRINDRGPFVEGRIIDLSYTAAYKLGVLASGSAWVEVESIIPDAAGTLVAAAPAPRPAPVPEEDPAADPGTTIPIAAAPVMAEPPPAAAPDAAVTAGAAGYYLQFGAFGSRENAESYLARLKAQLDWLSQVLQVFARDGLFRVRAGPYPSQAEAQRIAQRIGEALGVRPMVLTR